MADFEKAVIKTILLEGEYTDGAGDYGGETKYGISKRSYPDVDIVKLSVEGAKIIYKRDFWDRLRLDEVSNQAVAEELFDTSVNMTWDRPGVFLQQSLNLFALVDNRKVSDDVDAILLEQLALDGLVGPKTLAFLEEYTSRGRKYVDVLLKFLNMYQMSHYINQARSDVNQQKFLLGWVANRVGAIG